LAVFTFYLFALNLLNVAPCSSAEFIPLGFGASNVGPQNALTLSEDGAVVVGIDTHAGDWPFEPLTLVKWTQRTGLQILRDDVHPKTAVVSGNGTTVVAEQYIRQANEDLDGRPIMISPEGVQVLLPADSSAWLMSQDGNTVIGEERSLNPSVTKYFRWRNDTTETLPIEYDPPYHRTPTAVSANGEIVVGFGPAYRWSDQDGFQVLGGYEDEGSGVCAWGVSSNGRWIVGTEFRGTGSRTRQRALRWNDALQPEQLLTIDANWGASATDVAADGRVVVGYLLVADEGEQQDYLAAGIWLEELGRMIRLQDLLTDYYGLDPEADGYRLTGIRDVTDDGRYMVGTSFNPDGDFEAFYVDLGLRGDFDGDEVLDVDDLDELSKAIRSADTNLQYDIDYSSVVDSLDYQIWVTDLKGTWIGDANLDGEFNSSDLVAVFEVGQYEDAIAGNSSWAAGDWNGDAEFNTSDLVLAFQDGGYEQGPLGAATAVPEPNAWCLLLFGAVVSALGKRHATSS
jgi:uncharacterized membrane protein